MQKKEEKKGICLNGQEMELDENGQYVEVRKETAPSLWSDIRDCIIVPIIMVVLLFALPTIFSGMKDSIQKEGGASKTKAAYTLTIKYVYKDVDGKKVHPDSTSLLQAGETYIINTPILKGLTADQTTVSGVMGTQNKETIVVYTDAEDNPSDNPLNDPANSGNAMVGGGISR